MKQCKLASTDSEHLSTDCNIKIVLFYKFL